MTPEVSELYALRPPVQASDGISLAIIHPTGQEQGGLDGNSRQRPHQRGSPAPAYARSIRKANDANDGDCPPERIPTFRQLDDLISTTAWGEDARSEFFRRWVIVESATDKRFEVSSIAELAHLVWQEVCKNEPQLKHPLAPLIHAWHTGPMEVEAVRDTSGNLRSDTIAPRIAMRESGARTDRLYLPPAHIEIDGTGNQIVFPGFGEGNRTGRIPVLPIELYDLGVQAGVSRGGLGGAPIPARIACETSRRSINFREARCAVCDIQHNLAGHQSRTISA